MNEIIKKVMDILEGQTVDKVRQTVNKITKEYLCDPNGNSYTEIVSIGEYAKQIAQKLYTAQVEYQRQYCFTDTKWGNGHKWQRNLMASLITGMSLDYIWINVVTMKEGIEKHIIDGGQRSRTIHAFFTNCIKLPKNTLVKFKGDILDLSGLNWSEICHRQAEFAKDWQNTYNLEFKVFEDYTNEQCSEIFNKLNDVNSMSKPEYRNSIWSDLATFVRDLSDYENANGNTLEMFTRNQLENTTTGSMRGILHGIKFKKRSFDDFISKICYLTINPLKATSNKVLQEWYYTERDEKSTFTKKSKSSMKKNLKWINTLIMSESSSTSRKDLLSDTDLQVLLHIKSVLENSYELKITNGLDFINFWRRVKLTLLDDGKKSDNNRRFEFKDYNDQVIGWSICFSSMSSGRDEEIKEWIGEVSDFFIEEYKIYSEDTENNLPIGFKLLDKSRSIKKSVKEQSLVNQGFKCEYHEWCGNTVTMSSPGDHSETSHTDGGSSSDVDNCDMTCEDCNSEKGSMEKKYFSKVVEMKIKDRDAK